MKKVVLYAVTASMIFCNYACNKEDTPDILDTTKDDMPFEPIELTVKQAKKADADNRFAFNMFREVSALSDEPNTFFSPLSLNMALGMLYNGASGETRIEMAEILGMADFSETEINEYYQKMSQALLDIDPITDIKIANSIWYHDGFSVKQPFINVSQKYFDAVVRSLDFNRSDAAEIINGWCAEKTKDRIKDIIKEPIPDMIVIYLINALYFKSQWQFEFDKAYTKHDEFTKTDNRKIMVNMMEQTTDLLYYANQHLQCVEMPYGNQAFSMAAVLPASDKGIDDLLEYLNNDTWHNIINNLHKQNIWLKLPRFKIECDILLNEPLGNIGMTRIFDESLAGFENISDVNLFVSYIQQKTFVEVNEAGTEAAAVTVIGGGITSVDPEIQVQIPFFANRPFLYLIKEKSTGVILFIGRMDEPKE